MRRVALLGLLVALGCGDGPPEPPPPQPPPRPPLVWGRAQPAGWDMEIHVPKEWQNDPRFFFEGREVHFNGPLDDGWHPELIFGADPSPATLDEWGGRQIRAFEDSPFHEVFRKGSATVAGMPALFCVYGEERKTPAGETRQMRGIVFYFVGHGRRRFVRGVTTARSFPAYLPVFEEAAARVRYLPQ